MENRKNYRNWQSYVNSKGMNQLAKEANQASWADRLGGVVIVVAIVIIVTQVIPQIVPLFVR